jgi:hypothetical protein
MSLERFIGEPVCLKFSKTSFSVAPSGNEKDLNQNDTAMNLTRPVLNHK